MTDNTKDQVRVLREALEGVIRVADRATDEFDAARAALAATVPVDDDSHLVRIWNQHCDWAGSIGCNHTPWEDFKATRLARGYRPPAIPHSEQRETVAAGEVMGVSLYYAQAVIKYTGAAPIEGQAVYFVAPVAAPVPEAKAELSRNNNVGEGLRKAEARMHPDMPRRPAYRTEAKAEQVTELGHDRVRQIYAEWKHLGETGMGLYQRFRAAERQTAPAVKHEASELPPLVDLMRIIHSAGVMAADSSHINVAEAAYRAALAAPPIAVQGSGDAPQEVRKLLEFISTPGSVYSEYSEPLAKYIDSRSPVAAAPRAITDEQIRIAAEVAVSAARKVDESKIRDAALEEAAHMLEGAIHSPEWVQRKSVVYAIRALSAAAPSADAKGNDA